MKAYDVKTVRPCLSGGTIVEGHFGRALSMPELCTKLQGIAKCSEKLGVARFSHEGCDITIYRNGRVEVHGVASEDAAIEFINDIKLIVEMPLSISHLEQYFKEFNCIPDKSRTLYDEVVLIGLTRFRTASLLQQKICCTNASNARGLRSQGVSASA
jgi:hypothetical protein